MALHLRHAAHGRADSAAAGGPDRRGGYHHPDPGREVADELLARLGDNLGLNHRRSVGQAHSTLLDIRQGKDGPTLIRNTRMRFSSGTIIDLDDNLATRVLDIIRVLDQRAGAGAP